MITIYFEDSGCGSGKTYTALQRIAEAGGRHLFVVERVDAMSDRIRELQHLIALAERSMALHWISADKNHRLHARSVMARVEAIPDEFAQINDVVVFITHEALKLASLEAFAGQGWSIWIDEVPDVLDHDKHRFCLTWPQLQAIYRLEPSGSGKWSKVSLIGDSPELADLANDDGLEMLRPFHRRVADPRREVFIDITDWEELSVRGRELIWYSLWSPDDLRHFQSVVMLGNRLPSSASVAILNAKWPNIEWRRIPATNRSFAFRRVHITYFAENHCASRALFKTDQGQRNLAKIAEHIGFRVPPHSHIWTCNDPDVAHLKTLTGTHLRPRQSGSNSFAHVTNATMIYTAKPEPKMRAIYERLGVNPDFFTRSNEREVILQFMCRTSLREADDHRDVHLYVYDRQQAEYLRDCLEADPRGYVDCDLNLENLGFAYDVRDTRPGRRHVVLTPAEAAAKKESDRIKDRDRKRDGRAAKKAAAANDEGVS